MIFETPFQTPQTPFGTLGTPNPEFLNRRSGNLSIYWKNAILDMYFGHASIAVPPVLYFALWTSEPGMDSGGGLIGELVADSYERVAVTNDTNMFEITEDGTKENAEDIEFPEAEEDWGSVTHLVVMDAATGGNPLYVMELSGTAPILEGDVVKFEAGSFLFSVGAVVNR